MLEGGQVHRPSGKRVKELGLAYNTLHRWVKEYKESNGKSFVGSGNIKPQNQEIIELRRRNQELEEELRS